MEKTAFAIYLTVLVAGPLLFGAVHTYAYTFMTLGILVGSLLVTPLSIRKDAPGGGYAVHIPKTGAGFGILVILAWLFLQILPLPETVLRLLSPESWVVVEKSLPAADVIAGGPRGAVWHPLAPYVYPVRMSIIRFAAYGLFFFGLTRVLNSKRRIETAVMVILVTGCFEAVYGLYQAYAGDSHIWWFKRFTCVRNVTGTYINRNHFAGFMEMGIVLAASYAAALSMKTAGTAPALHSGDFRSRLSRFLAKEQRFSQRTFILFAGVCMGVGLIFSVSRGGMIATAVALLVMGLLLVSRKRHRRAGWVILVIFTLIAAYSVHIGIQYPIERFKSFGPSFEIRKRFALRTMEMVDAYRLTGVGVGNFRYAYPRYQAPEDGRMLLRYAHNDWAQFLAEAGTVGFCLMLAGISGFLFHIFSGLRKRKNPVSVCLGMAPPAAFAAMAVHSYSDFNLHIPANFLTLSAVAAIGVSALHLKQYRDGERLRFRVVRLPLRSTGGVVLLCLLMLVGWTGSWTVRHFIAETYCNTVHNSTLNRDPNPPPEEIRAAVAWDPGNARYRYKLAEALKATGRERREEPDQTGEDITRSLRQITGVLEDAVRLNPFEATVHHQLGWEYMALGMAEPDHRRIWLAAADLSMERAIYFTGDKNPRRYVKTGYYWVARSRALYRNSPQWRTAWNKAIWHFRKGLAMAGPGERKRLIRYIRKNVQAHYPDVAVSDILVPID